MALNIDLNCPPPAEYMWDNSNPNGLQMFQPQPPVDTRNNFNPNGMQMVQAQNFEAVEEITMISPQDFAQAKIIARGHLEVQAHSFPGRTDALGFLINQQPQRLFQGVHMVSNAFGTAPNFFVGTLIPAVRGIIIQAEHLPESSEHLPESSEPPRHGMPTTQILQCPICLDRLKEETTTRCGHIFCKKCIEHAIRTSKKCPTCRRKLRKSDTFRIYLPTN